MGASSSVARSRRRGNASRGGPSDSLQGSFKLGLFGSAGCGKSALTLQFVAMQFPEIYDPTIEDNYRKQISMGDSVVLIDVLDTAGQVDFLAMSDQWIRMSEGFILVYDISNMDSFEALKETRERIALVKELEKPPCVVVGNKSDLESERVVTVELGKAFADSIGATFLEASARAYINVDDIFRAAVKKVFDSRPHAIYHD